MFKIGRSLSILLLGITCAAGNTHPFRLSDSCGFSAKFSNLPTGFNQILELWGSVDGHYVDLKVNEAYWANSSQCYLSPNFLSQTTSQEKLAFLNDIAIQKGITEITGYPIEDNFYIAMIKGITVISEIEVTTTLHLMASELGFTVIELTADSESFPYKENIVFLKSIRAVNL